MFCVIPLLDCKKENNCLEHNKQLLYNSSNKDSFNFVGCNNSKLKFLTISGINIYNNVVFKSLVGGSLSDHNLILPEFRIWSPFLR